MAYFNIELSGLMVKVLDYHAKGPWFKSHQEYVLNFLLQKHFFFQKSNF